MIFLEKQLFPALMIKKIKSNNQKSNYQSLILRNQNN